MNRISRYMAACLVLGLALMGTPLSAASAKTKSKSPSIIGKLQKVDGQTLTIQTKKGAETVMLSPSVQIHHGATTLAATELVGQTGSRVKIRYHVANGHKEAQSITVSSATKVARTSTSAGSKTGKAKS